MGDGDARTRRAHETQLEWEKACGRATSRSVGQQGVELARPATSLAHTYFLCPPHRWGGRFGKEKRGFVWVAPPQIGLGARLRVYGRV
jgi:hypothetical protein